MIHVFLVLAALLWALPAQATGVVGTLTNQPPAATSVLLDWADVPGAAAYEIERCAGAACSNFAVLQSRTMSRYNGVAMSPNSTYRYRVRARDVNSIYGAYSPILNITTASPPPTTSPLLTGATATNVTIPSGWTAIAVQGFESRSVPSTQFINAAITTAQAHTGTQAMGGTISGDGQSVRWSVNQGTHTSREVYLSWWEYMSADGSFNDEMFGALFKWVNPADGTNFQHVYADWYWAVANQFGNGAADEGLYNAPAGSLLAASEGVGPGELHTIYYDSGYRPAVAPQIGGWAQYEVHFKANTPALSDGFYRVYVNGVQVSNLLGTHHNGDNNIAGMQVHVGGTYTRHVWRYPTSANPTRCGLFIGDGEAISVAGQPVSNYRCTDFNNCSCPPNTQPFERYFDDIIVMVPTGTGSGPDTQAPTTPVITVN